MSAQNVLYCTSWGAERVKRILYFRHFGHSLDSWTVLRQQKKFRFLSWNPLMSINKQYRLLKKIYRKILLSVMMSWSVVSVVLWAVACSILWLGVGHWFALHCIARLTLCPTQTWSIFIICSVTGESLSGKVEIHFNTPLHFTGTLCSWWYSVSERCGWTNVCHWIFQ